MVRVLFALALCVATVSAFVAPANHAGKSHCSALGILFSTLECIPPARPDVSLAVKTHPAVGFGRTVCVYSCDVESMNVSSLFVFFRSLQSLILPTRRLLRPR